MKFCLASTAVSTAEYLIQLVVYMFSLNLFLPRLMQQSYNVIACSLVPAVSREM